MRPPRGKALQTITTPATTVAVSDDYLGDDGLLQGVDRHLATRFDVVVLCAELDDDHSL